MLGMATRAENKSIFEAAREIAVAESPLGKKLQFLEYSRPHIEAVEEIISEFESRYKIERIIGESIFGPDGVTPVWVHADHQGRADRFFYGCQPGYYDHLAVCQSWRVNLEDRWFIQINLFVGDYGGSGDFLVEMGRNEEDGGEFRKHGWINSKYESAPVDYEQRGRHFGKRRLRCEYRYEKETTSYRSNLQILVAEALAKYMKLNNLVEVKIQDVKVRKANEVGVTKTAEPRGRVVPERIVRYEVVGGTEDQVETNCLKCNGDYGGKFAQMCPYCGVSRKVFYVRRGEYIK